MLAVIKSGFKKGLGFRGLGFSFGCCWGGGLGVSGLGGFTSSLRVLEGFRNRITIIDKATRPFEVIILLLKAPILEL